MHSINNIILQNWQQSILLCFLLFIYTLNLWCVWFRTLSVKFFSLVYPFSHFTTSVCPMCTCIWVRLFVLLYSYLLLFFIVAADAAIIAVTASIIITTTVGSTLIFVCTHHFSFQWVWWLHKHTALQWMTVMINSKTIKTITSFVRLANKNNCMSHLFFPVLFNSTARTDESELKCTKTKNFLS